MRKVILYASAILAFIGVLVYALRPTEIRVRNASNLEFKNVVVKDKRYGDIPPGGTTSYQQWTEAYLYEPVSLSADSKEFTYRVMDHMGEKPLGAGKFTYVIRAAFGYIDIRAEPDID